jgi:hypothetical protein
MNRSALYPPFLSYAVASAYLAFRSNKWKLFIIPILTVIGLSELVRADSDDEALWKQLDITQDGWLDGKELEGGWIRFDTDGDGEVTKREFFDGLAKERANSVPSKSSSVVPPPSGTTNKWATRQLTTKNAAAPQEKADEKGGRPSIPVPTVMSKSKIEGLFYMQRYDMVSRHLEKAVWYFGTDGKVYVNPELGFSSSELAEHKGLFGTYQIENGQMNIAWSNNSKSKDKLGIAADSFEFDTATFLPVKPFENANQMIGNYEGGSSFTFSGNSTAIAKTLNLRADGTFSSSGIANFSKARNETDSSDTGNKKLIASGHSSSTGTWSLTGYSLTLRALGEEDVRGIVFPLFHNETKGPPDRLFFRGIIYKK